MAKQIAIKLHNKQPIMIAAEFLIGNVRTLRNQMCENSKHFATYLTLPDLNHFATIYFIFNHLFRISNTNEIMKLYSLHHVT